MLACGRTIHGHADTDFLCRYRVFFRHYRNAEVPSEALAEVWLESR
jgi:hypothetical protein